jgi:ABC-type uncharacterized transport system auxiliary subunit
VRACPVFVAALLTMCACGSLPQTHFYRLTPATFSAVREPIAGVLAIATLEAEAVYSDDGIVYRTSPNKVDYYSYHRWTSPPAVQLTDYLADAFERTGLFRQVESEPSSVTQAVLSGRLTSFDEVDVTETQWIGRVELQLQLQDPRSGVMFWSKRYVESEPIAQRSPEGLAVALSVAMQRIVTSSATELASAMQAQTAAKKSEQSLAEP